jgi:hypothetical protein
MTIEVDVIDSGLSDDLLKTATQYCLFDELQNFNPDLRQSNRMHYKYADPLMETILLQLKSLIEKRINKVIYPTYSYYRVYRNNGTLDRHLDRESCEISASLSIGHNLNDPWPLFMGDQKIYLKPGELVLYPGCDLPHWRDRLQCDSNQYCVQGFFHYVSSDGPYLDFIFDKREGIGYPSNYKNYIVRK